MKNPKDEILKIECKGEDTVLKISVGDEFYYQFHQHELQTAAQIMDYVGHSSDIP